MKRACLTALGKIELLDIPEPPEPAPDEVLVRIRSCGICGSDALCYKTGRIGNYDCEYPQAMGHQAAGEVDEAGARSGFSSGDRVAIEPLRPCGQCEQCEQGHFSLCPQAQRLGGLGLPGAMQKRMIVKAKHLVHITEDISFDEASLLEPLGVAYHSLVHLANIQEGDTLAVFGAGPIGLLCAQLAKRCGASAVLLSDPLEFRLDFAMNSIGADAVFNPTRDDVPHEVLEFTERRGVDIAIDAAGVQQSVDHAIESAALGARVLLIGIPAVDKLSYNPHAMRRKQLSVFSARGANQTLESCVELVSEQDFSMKGYVTNKYSLESAAQGFKDAASIIPGLIKAVINP